MCHFLIWCQVREGNSLLLNGFSEIIHNMSWRDLNRKTEACFSSLCFQTSLWNWQSGVMRTLVLPSPGWYQEKQNTQALIWPGKRKRLFWTGRKNDIWWKPEKQAAYVFLQRSDKITLCEIICRPKNNVSIAFLIVPFYPEWFFQSWNLALE